MAPRNTRVAPETEVRSPARSFLNSIDTFYGAARDTRSEQATQRGISAFAGLVDDQANRMKQERNANETAAGIQDAMREQAGQEMEGIKNGSLFRQHSSFYMAGLNETRGKAAATRFKQETALAYEQWDGRFADDDGSLFREWMNERVGGFMGSLGDDRNKLAGALPIINETAANFATQHTGATANRLQDESFEAYDEIVSGVFTDLANGELDVEAAVDAIAFEADEMYGSDGAAANDRVVEAAIRYANTHNDPEAILVLAKAHDAGKLKLSLVNREKLANGMDAVEADIQRETSKRSAKETAEAQVRKRELQTAWYEVLSKDPYADLTTWTAENGVEGEHFQTLAQLQTSFVNASTVENPQITTVSRMALETDLYGASTPQEKISILARFTRDNPTALSGADVASYTKSIFAEADPGSLINNPTVAKYRAGFGRTLAEFQLGDGFDINRSSYLSTQGERHYNDFLLASSGGVDMQDPKAVRTLVKEAEEYAMEQLAFEFPEVLREKNEQSPLGSTLGADQALETRDAEVAAQAAAEFGEMVGVPTENPEAVEAEGVGEVPEADLEVPLENVEPVMDNSQENPVSTQDPEVLKAQPDTFYEEVLNRFIDGTDDRTDVSPSVLVETAKRLLGANERKQNDLISEFLADGGVNLDPRETAWCAGFVNSVLSQNGLDGTGRLNARSFLDWGSKVDAPQEGDIVVFSRGDPNGWEGHVGFFQGFDAKGNIMVLGGNQGDSVSITSYPARKLLGYRRPPGNFGSNTTGDERIARTVQRIGGGNYLPQN